MTFSSAAPDDRSRTAYIQADKLWKFERIVVGDFRATFGQGLIMNGAFNAGKSSYVLKVTPSQNGLVRKSSSDEYNFFRGVGATVRINNINITAIYLPYLGLVRSFLDTIRLHLLVANHS